MAVTPTYPGVYIQEIPSGVRTIVGVSTSITAFIGRAPRGPVNEAARIFNFGDFERRFGGLHVDYPMSYAVRDFYANGGSEAVIVRLVNTGAQKTTFKIGNITLEAAYPGSWGNKLKATIDRNTSKDVAERYGITVDDLFNLTITDDNSGTQERLINLSVKDTPRRIDRVLEAESELLRWSGPFNITALTLPNVEASSGAAGTPDDPSGTAETPDDPRITARITALNAQKALVTAEQSLSKALYEMQEALVDAKINLTEKEGKPETTIAELNAAQEGVNLARENVNAAQKALNLAREEVTENLAKAIELEKKEVSVVGGGEGLDNGAYLGNELAKTGIYALEDVDLFNLLCIPPDKRGGDTSRRVYDAALAYCVRRRAFLIVDPPKGWQARDQLIGNPGQKLTDEIGLSGDQARNAAIYYPRVKQADPNRDGQVDTFVPCGIVAGVMARTDAQRGVWKAPAGIDASLNGMQALEVELTDLENGALNQVGINCLRSFPIYGRVAWGARTLRGADQAADEYKYVPVRRTALFIEESLYRGLKWVVFEPNDEPLWAQIRLNVGAFMQSLFRRSAFQGTSPRAAYFVKCDKETTTQDDINKGIVNVVVGFAPLKPAEFVVVKLQQIAGQIEV